MMLVLEVSRLTPEILDFQLKKSLGFIKLVLQFGNAIAFHDTTMKAFAQILRRKLGNLIYC